MPQVVLGVVYNPFTKELYQAVEGCGAFLNGRGLEVSRTTAMEEAMVVSGKKVVKGSCRPVGQVDSAFG